MQLIRKFAVTFFTLLALFTGACSQVVVKTDTIAERVLAYQLDNGGWPKQLFDKSVVNYSLPLTKDLIEKIKNTPAKHATIDNKATTREINMLIMAFRSTANPNYIKAAEKGIAYLLEAQYPNGGWPQYYPDNSLYRAEITLNDDAMVNVLTVMLNIVKGEAGFGAIDKSYKQKAEAAISRGVDCILKLQINQHGNKTIWAAQYDQNTLAPAKARAFEPKSLSTGESVGVVRFLMKLDQPTEDIKLAINSAVKWFDENKKIGFKYQRDATGSFSLVESPDAWYWARFYDLESNKPIFGDRDGSIKYDIDELSAERRNGYAWYGDFAQKLLKSEYPNWKKKTF